MIKFGLMILVAVSVLLLGLTTIDPGLDPHRGPVPSTQKVAHSSHCSGCHGFDPTMLALVDSAGNDISIYNDWQISMMGLAAHDPFWRATVAHEVNQYPAAQEAIESTCLRCHAPLGSIQAHLDGKSYSYSDMLGDTLGLDGVSCSACHQQPADNLGKGLSGYFTVDTNRLLYGPYPTPFLGPMQIYVGFNPVFSDHIYSSGVCAGCHTLITGTLKDDGTPSGDFFVEQATYHEWLNSSYPAQQIECQTCHMPFIKGGVIIASDFLSLYERSPFGLHQFFGANTAMLDMMKANRAFLGLPSGPAEKDWDQSISNNRISLSKAAELSTSSMWVANDTLYLGLSIKNKTGHKFPSGYPSRISWLQILLTNADNQDTLYSNGVLDDDGNIAGRDFPYEPHHQISKSDEDVQIYEMVMSDLHGQLTTKLNAAYRPLKDNRLLPLGFKTNTATYDTVAVWGEAAQDPDYGAGSGAGLDKIEYRIPLNGYNGLVDLAINLRYHTLPSRWMNELFSHDTVAQIAQFKSMYQGYETFDELVDEITMEGIDLSTTSIKNSPLYRAISLYPNPVSDRSLHFIVSDEFISGKLRYEIYNLHGIKLQSGPINDIITLNPSITEGLYYSFMYNENQLISISPFVVL